MAKYKTEVITAAGHEVKVTFKPVKAMRLRVSNRDGSVSMSVPRLTSHRRIVAMIEENRLWLDDTYARIQKRLAQAQISYEAGSLHLLFGNRLSLRYATGEDLRRLGLQGWLERENPGWSRGQVWADKEFLWVWLPAQANPEAAPEEVPALVESYFDSLLREALQGFLEKWFGPLGLSPIPFRVRKMSSRWGSYSAKTRKITFNRSLVHYRRALIEYVVVHELTHSFDMSHGPVFCQHMDKALPNWRTLRRELNRH